MNHVYVILNERGGFVTGGGSSAASRIRAYDTERAARTAAKLLRVRGPLFIAKMVDAGNWERVA